MAGLAVGEFSQESQIIAVGGEYSQRRRITRDTASRRLSVVISLLYITERSELIKEGSTTTIAGPAAATFG